MQLGGGFLICEDFLESCGCSLNLVFMGNLSV